MATIEERAKQYTDNVYEVVMSGDFKGDCIAKNAYISGATEQRKIDIDNACEWLKVNSETMHYLNGDSTCEMLFNTADDMIAYFRKVMEE